MKLEKSSGTTPTERLLANLCEQSFLKLWSYPNPFKDDGHELCDLLAVFENHVFIFFDREKQITVSSDNDPSLQWERWKRKVIDAQTRTAHGAERYIRRQQKVYLDAKCQIPFPIEIDMGRMIVHKIIVAHGAKEACLSASDDNLYGSLAISYGGSSQEPSFPFMVSIDKEKPVHVLDSHNLTIVLNELDTIADLAMYFDAKQKAIEKYDSLLYCGEEDLLAHYYLNFDESNKQHFIGTNEPDFTGIVIGEGEWKGFTELSLYLATKKANEISYLWDEILQITCQNSLDGTLIGNSDLLGGRSALHEMAKEPRFSRRVLSEGINQAISNFPKTVNDLVRHVMFIPSFYPDKGYVFLQLNVPPRLRNESDYRSKRQHILEIACGAAKNKFPDIRTIVGIAIDAPKFVEENSEDFILMECGDWTKDQQIYYEKANQGWDFFCTPDLRQTHRTFTEFQDG